ncbi:hypothetical protein HMPREF9554_01414 [Treponema phagedenis F0421]|nr:hypothetical protein HMPREF9554_01414 [Treponema phagedenis F0421]
MRIIPDTVILPNKYGYQTFYSLVLSFMQNFANSHLKKNKLFQIYFFTLPK